MRRVAVALFAFVCGVAAPVSALAALHEIKVTLDPGPGAQFAQQAGIDIATLQTQIQNEVEKSFQLYRVDDYLRSFADAQSFTTKGLGADYASNIDYFMVGAAANVAIDADKAFIERQQNSGEPPITGLTTNVTLMGGVNLGLLGARPLTLYVNYFHGKGSYREFSSAIDNVGAHAQLKLFGPHKSSLLHALVKWGGIDITTGFDRAHQTLSLGQAKQLSRSVSVGAMGVDADVALRAMGNFQLDLSTWTIPLEVTTNVRLLQILSVYGGAGFDWQLGGKAEMKIDVTGDMFGSVPSQGVKDQKLGTANITATGDTKPSSAKLRALVGAQVNVLLFKVFTQLNYSPELGTASVAFGARVAY